MVILNLSIYMNDERAGGKARGIAQLQNALEVIDKDRPHPFKPGRDGHSKLYVVVDDDELLFPKTEAGFARLRAEAPAYHWEEQKSGEPKPLEIPHALFNDAIDCARAAAADYWPRSLEKTLDERIIEQMPPESRAVIASGRPPSGGWTPETQLKVQYDYAAAQHKLRRGGPTYFDENGQRIDQGPTGWFGRPPRYGYGT